MLHCSTSQSQLERGRLLWDWYQNSNLLLVETVEVFGDATKVVNLEHNLIRQSTRSLLLALQRSPHTPRGHEPVSQEQKPVGPSQNLSKDNPGAVDPLRILERCPSIRVDRVDLLRICADGLDVQNEPKLAQQCTLKVITRLRALWYPLVQIVHDGRRDGESNGITRLERVLFSNVADLVDVCLDEFQTVSFDRPAPLLELVLNATSGRSNPLQLEVEAGGGVVDDIMV